MKVMVSNTDLSEPILKIYTVLFLYFKPNRIQKTIFDISVQSTKMPQGQINT